MSLEKYICRTAGCPVYGDWAIVHKYKVGWDKVQRGDSILFDINHNGTSDHVGIVTKVGDGYVETIEANTGSNSVNDGDGVWRKTRKKSSGLINYFVHPPLSKAQRESLIRVAESQVGYQEGKNNNNKYGRWYGANYQPYCMIFVYWCYCHASGEELKPVDKPTGKYSGTLPTSLVKYGTKGNDTLLWQKFLNWYHADWKLAEDGECGSATAEATSIFQLTEGITADGEAGNDTYTKAKVYLAEEKKGYAGDFPDFVSLSGDIIAQTARNLAYSEKYFKNNKSKCTWNKNRTTHATDSFVKAINKVFPNRKSWSKQCQDGASCDVGSATALRYSGALTDIPRGLDGQTPYLKKSNRVKTTGINKSANTKAGDIGYYINKKSGGHIWINLGGGYVAEANHTSKYFFHIIKKSINNSSGRKIYENYRMKVAIREYIKEGDVGAEALKLQKFLNWYGGYGLATDGDIGAKSVTAIKDFQTKEGLEVDGVWGKLCNAKAKEIKR